MKTNIVTLTIIHHLQPDCLIGNNHHITPFEGEDIQLFERDLSGEKKAGVSVQEISPLPFETCETMELR
jgi:alpha-L-fucosidase